MVNAADINALKQLRGEKARELGFVAMGFAPASDYPLRARRLPALVNVALIVRGDRNIAPTGDTTVEPEDHIFALVTGEGEEALRQTILSEQSGE